MTLTKRRFLVGAATLGGVVRLPPMAFADATTVQPLRDVYLEAHVRKTRLRIDGPETDVLGFAGQDPFPVLRVPQGQALTVRVTNSLDSPTSLQWHGIRGANALDKTGTHRGSAIAPGATEVLIVTPPDSGTYWFHPDPNGADQGARGLYGVLIVEEARPPLADRDLVYLLADWPSDTLDQTGGAKRETQAAITIAGQPTPAAYTFQPGARLRLRLLNASTRRAMLVGCEGAHPVVVAVDGQPCEIFKPVRDTIPIGPGARYDYLLDLPGQGGQTVTLTLKGVERIGNAIEPDRPLASFHTAGEPLPAKPPIAALAGNTALPLRIPLERAKRAELTIESGPPDASGRVGWTINGASGVTLPKDPVLRVRQGSAVVFGFNNKSTALVPIRVYGQTMRVLHPMDDGWEPYWRDSVLLPAGGRSHVAFVADMAGRWLIESGFNSQVTHGLRCWFEVTPG